MGVEVEGVVDVDATLEDEELVLLEAEALELIDVELRDIMDVRIRLGVVVVAAREVVVEVRTGGKGVNVGFLNAGVAMRGSSRSPWSPRSIECSSHSLSSPSSLPVTDAWTTSRYTASRIKASSSMIQSSPGTKKCAVMGGRGGIITSSCGSTPVGEAASPRHEHRLMWSGP